MTPKFQAGDSVWFLVNGFFRSGQVVCFYPATPLTRNQFVYQTVDVDGMSFIFEEGRLMLHPPIATPCISAHYFQD